MTLFLFLNKSKCSLLGTQSLDGILNNGKSKCDKKGLGFFKKSSTSGKTSTVFVRTSSNIDNTVEEPILKEEGSAIQTKVQRIFERRICHYCGQPRHIRLCCYCLHGYFSNRRFLKMNASNSEFKYQWRVKSKEECIKCNVAFTSNIR